MSSRERFERDGFVAVESFLSRSEVATCLREVERYVAEVIPGLPAEHVFYENKDDLATLKQLQRMHEHDAWFGEFFACLLYTSPSPRDRQKSRMPSSA